MKFIFLLFASILVMRCGAPSRAATNSMSPLLTDSMPPTVRTDFVAWKDSMKRYTAAYFKKLETADSLRSISAKEFTLDEKTGEAQGCPYLKFVGSYNSLELWKEDSARIAANELKFKNLLPKLEKSWTNTKKSLPKDDDEAIAEYPEYGYFSSDGKYVVAVENEQVLTRLYFFDAAGNFLRKAKLDQPLDMPVVDFNTEGTFFMVSSRVEPSFYFFTADGKLLKKGNYNNWTGDDGGCYGSNAISKHGKYWILHNCENYIYNQTNQLIGKTLGTGFAQIDEDRNLVMGCAFDSIIFSDLLTSQTVFRLNKNNNIGRIVIGEGILSLNFKNNPNKNFKYEIFK